MNQSHKWKLVFGITLTTIAIGFSQDDTPQFVKMNKKVHGTLHFFPLNGDAASELNFCLDTLKHKGIKKDSTDLRSCFFIYPVEKMLGDLKVSQEDAPHGDFCWQWDATILVKEYLNGFGTEGGADIAKAELIRAGKLKKTCT